MVVSDLTVRYPIRRSAWRRSVGWVTAVDGVSMAIRKGECFGLVGESGSGKTSLGRAVIRLVKPTAGAIRFKGHELAHLSTKTMRPFRRKLQIIFQDPDASLDPRMRVLDLVTEPLWARGRMSVAQRRQAAVRLCEKVGLAADDVMRYPHSFSGGQRQRIGIARALCAAPELIVADEPVSALDVSIQAQVLNLLIDLQQSQGLSYLFISHDVRVVERICDRLAVMYQGRLVETAPAFDFSRQACHPYSRFLLSAMSDANQDNVLPSAQQIRTDSVQPPAGCSFYPQCGDRQPRCRHRRPRPVTIGPDHQVACWYGRGLEPAAS